MTGYGRGECSQDGFKITVELSSVNRKQTEISINLPREMELLEAQARDVINRYIARGRLTVRVTLHSSAGNAARLTLPFKVSGSRLRWTKKFGMVSFRICSDKCERSCSGSISFRAT